MKKKPSNNGRDRLIFALDVGEDMEEAVKWVDLLKDHVGMFKVGKEAFTRFGPPIISKIRERGGGVFLDLKFHDIPNTVARAAEAAVKLDLFMFNIHAMGGRKMMTETVEAVRKIAENTGVAAPMILAVTVLTSLDDEDIKEIGFGCRTDELVLNLSKLTKESGVSGVVASARDAASIRKSCGEDFVIVTPGIRWEENMTNDDQKRVLTPKKAIRSGADYIVVGRPIRTAGDPVAVADEIGREISEELMLPAQ